MLEHVTIISRPPQGNSSAILLDGSRFDFFRHEVEKYSSRLLSGWSLDLVFVDMGEDEGGLRSASTDYDVVKRWATIRLNRLQYPPCDDQCLSRLAVHELGHLLTGTLVHWLDMAREGWSVPHADLIEAEVESISRALETLVVGSQVSHLIEITEPTAVASGGGSGVTGATTDDVPEEDKGD